MNRKIGVVIILLAVIIIVTAAYIFTDGFQKSIVDTSVTFKISSTGTTVQKIGDYNYYFTYQPSYGHITITREDENSIKQLPITPPDLQQNCSGMSYIIKETRPDYAVISANPIL
jgi:hypothetical protein